MFLDKMEHFAHGVVAVALAVQPGCTNLGLGARSLHQRIPTMKVALVPAGLWQRAHTNGSMKSVGHALILCEHKAKLNSPLKSAIAGSMKLPSWINRRQGRLCDGVVVVLVKPPSFSRRKLSSAVVRKAVTAYYSEQERQNRSSCETSRDQFERLHRHRIAGRSPPPKSETLDSIAPSTTAR